MYGFDVSNLISALKVSEDISWSSFFEMMHAAWCGPFYTVDLHVIYGVTGAPAPSVTDHLVVMQKGQILHCDVMLIGEWGLSHPVKCTIKDSLGNEVWTKTKWITSGFWEVQPRRDFFRNVSLPVGTYTVDWSVCEGSGSHSLTVHDPGFITNDIDIDIGVTDTAGINPYAVWNEIKEDVRAEMLIYNAIVELIDAEISGKHLIIFHLRVAVPPDISVGGIGIDPITIVVLVLIAIIAFLLVGLPTIERILYDMYAYNLATLEYTYKDCAGLLFNEYVACMIGTYPDVWAEMKGYIRYPELPEKEPDWLTYIMYIVLAVGAIAGVYILVKYVMPALKGRR